MPTSARVSRNANIARSRALHTHVYISGLKGHHTLETGLAYYYRGHYIYIYPAGNLIEPIQYSIRKGIMIQGIVSASAPVYDVDKEGLVDESSVSALKASIQTETAALKQSSDNTVTEAESPLDLKSSSPTPPQSQAQGRSPTPSAPPSPRSPCCAKPHYHPPPHTTARSSSPPPPQEAASPRAPPRRQGSAQHQATSVWRA
ncbi:hypothetical protein EJ07DRAFT_171400 [Lizonia empirigonia]|nr:hypothetical protein EJ07DRAFT_171400 [Lizonia empirigonia]